MMIEDLFRRPYHEYLNDIIKNMVDGVISENEVLVREIKEWLESDTRKSMLVGEAYYRNKTDIREKKRDIVWKSNIKLEHGFAKKLVDQKIGYLLTKEPTIATEKNQYREQINDVFDRKVLKTLKNVGKEAINKGIGYLYVYFDERGVLSFKKFPSEQIIPFWKDDEHTELSSFIRVYNESIYMNGKKQVLTKIEYHYPDGIKYFLLEGGKLVADVPAGIEVTHHFTINDQPFLWTRIPLIPFKYNEEEQPLIDQIKSLIDNYNTQASTNSDLLADIPQFIYKLINYGGTDLKEFLSDLNLYRAVNLDENGDLDKLQATPETDATEKELDRGRKSIYEFGRGVDTTDANLGNASGVALRYRYSDLDMDCNILETELQASLEHLLWFVNEYFLMTDQGDFTKESVNIIFNRDIIIAESDVIQDCQNSVGILDDKTIRENHPWYNEEVEKRLEEQSQKEKDEYDNYLSTFKEKRGGLDGQET
ncbi:phage portal protein [Peribacillus loiseleuriae]|uniref:Phage portal protein n=2 Tax=Peribacillus loiseleuriae TaxID=1679170 RepID=A0A0K9GRA1_9BACI|nr:phage portal protein [Peribacillus loiseleuriae]